jgi:hypothetical protein
MRHRKKHRQSFLALTYACAGIAWLFMVLPADAQTAQPATKSASAKLPSTEKFSTVNAAAEHCPNDMVVWSTLSKSRVFHLSDSKYYGKTRACGHLAEGDSGAGYSLIHSRSAFERLIYGPLWASSGPVGADCAPATW